MKLLVTGVSHKTAPVEVRERLAFREETLAPALADLKSRDGVTEALILSTCNRVEIVVTTDDAADPHAVVDAFLTERKSVDASTLAAHLFSHEGKDAIHHLFRVAASLDSMVIGEPQILGQLKIAYAHAKDCGAVCGWMDGLLTRAFSVAKRVRSETGIGQMAVSVSYAAVEVARNLFGSLSGHSVMIVGSGKMGELAAKHLRRSGANRVFVTNRTAARAQEMALMFDGHAVDYAQFPAMLHEVDIVIASSGAPHYIITREDMQRVIAQRRNKPMFLIDIAVPRNIDPAVNNIDNVFLYDVDDLEGVVNANLRERGKQAEQAESIVAHEVEQMMARLKVDEIAPTIVSLQQQLEEIRAAEVARTVRRMPGITAEQREQIEAMTRSIVNKIAHGPISELRRNAAEPEGVHAIEVIRKVFHLHR